MQVSNIGEGLAKSNDSVRAGIREGQIAAGFARGAGDLATGTVQGVFGSAAGFPPPPPPLLLFSLPLTLLCSPPPALRFSGAFGKGLAQLSFDGDYKRARALLERARPLHAGQGVVQGGRLLGRGVVQGVAGVVAMPVKGCRAPRPPTHSCASPLAAAPACAPAALAPKRAPAADSARRGRGQVCAARRGGGAQGRGEGARGRSRQANGGRS